MNEDQAALENFAGTARLFPLPGLVFYPHALQPLHIFEPRYRQMTADALAGDRLIALVLLRPGWEQNYDQKPIIHEVACLGRIIADQLLPDGRYNMILRGLARIRILAEVPSEKLYRQARVEVLNDVDSADIPALMASRKRLEQLVLPRLADQRAREHMRGLFHGELPLGELVDSLAFSLPLPFEGKQEMLAEVNVLRRAALLEQTFTELIGGPRDTPGKRFPPDFSEN